MTSSSRMGFLDKMISKAVIAGLNNDLNLNLDLNGRNDLRDWEKIREFTNKFIKTKINLQNNENKTGI